MNIYVYYGYLNDKFWQVDWLEEAQIDRLTSLDKLIQ